MSSLFNCPAGLRELCLAAPVRPSSANITASNRTRAFILQRRAISIDQLEEAKNGA